MIQKDYYLRMIEEFGRALANFMERRHDAARRDREMAYSIDRHNKMEAIRRILKDKG